MALTALNGRDSHTPLWALIALNGRELSKLQSTFLLILPTPVGRETEEHGNESQIAPARYFLPCLVLSRPVKGPLFPRVTPGRSNKARAGGQIQLVQMWERIPQATWPSIEVFTYRWMLPWLTQA